MTTSFSPDTFNILNFSKEEASRLHCGSVSPLHLLLGIIRHTDNKASQLLAYYLPDGITALKSQLEQTARQHQVLISPTPADMNFDTQANRIMRLCKLEASLMKSESIEPIHVLLAILKANDNEASDILQRMNITYEKVQMPSKGNAAGDENFPNDGEAWKGNDDDDDDMEPVSAGLEGNVISIRQQKKQESKTRNNRNNYRGDRLNQSVDNAGHSYLLFDCVTVRAIRPDRVLRVCCWLLLHFGFCPKHRSKLNHADF